MGKAVCASNENLEHLTRSIWPDPDWLKNLLTHTLFWKWSDEQPLDVTVLVGDLTDLFLDKFQGFIFERRTGQLWKMVCFCFDLLTVMIDG